jgi:hypothetical protein
VYSFADMDGKEEELDKSELGFGFLDLGLV